MKEDKLMAHDPLSDADAILSEEYYGKRADAAAPKRAKPPRLTHYKVICISMYTRDLEELDRESRAEPAKRRGLTKANKSQLIRLALSRRCTSRSCRIRSSSVARSPSLRPTVTM